MRFFYGLTFSRLVNINDAQAACAAAENSAFLLINENHRTTTNMRSLFGF